MKRIRERGQGMPSSDRKQEVQEARGWIRITRALVLVRDGGELIPSIAMCYQISEKTYRTSASNLLEFGIHFYVLKRLFISLCFLIRHVYYIYNRTYFCAEQRRKHFLKRTTIRGLSQERCA